MSRSDLPQEPRLPSTKAAERLAVIVDAAERAALSVIDDAEKEARRYLEEAQVRADLIVAERLREAADLLERHRRGAPAEPRLRPLEPEPSVAEEEEAEPPPPEPVPPPAPPPAPEPPRPPEPPPAPEPPAPAMAPPPPEVRRLRVEEVGFEDPEEAAPPRVEPPTPPPPPVEEAPAPQHSGSAAARLLATQMAVSGASRQEIEMRLRNGFHIEDTGEILDAILGPEE